MLITYVVYVKLIAWKKHKKFALECSFEDHIYEEWVYSFVKKKNRKAVAYHVPVLGIPQGIRGHKEGHHITTRMLSSPPHSCRQTPLQVLHFIYL